MTGPSLDLDALREKAEAVIGQGEPAVPAVEIEADAMYVGQIAGSAVIFCLAAPDWLAVLALVEEQRDRISTLEEALGKYGGHAPECFREKLFGSSGCICGWDQQKDALWNAALDALAGSPAENKEPS